MLRVLSLGGGVQSSALLLMAEEGVFDQRPGLAVFADTGWEPPWVYDYLSYLDEQTSIEIARVSKGNLKEDLLNADSDSRFASIPVFTRDPETGKVSMLRRQCTREYKVEPIHRYLRSRLGPGRPQPASVELWIGISLDEAQRMKPSRRQWIENRWPLIERRISRAGCLAWLKDRGYRLPKKSSCIGCPFHDDGFWRDLRDNHPELWNDAVAFDRRIRRLPRVHHDCYLHRQAVPLSEVDLSTEEDRGQIAFGFSAECEGMCGV